MFALNKILLPVDFSDKCAGAARYAKALAAHFGSEIILLHVVEPHRLVGAPELGVPAVIDLSAQQREGARAQLQRFRAKTLADVRAVQVVLDGDPAGQIVEYAHAEGADLVVMPTHGYGPFRRFLLGSVVAKVLHDADCPIWTGVHLEEAPAPETISFRMIACAVELGPHAEKVLAWSHGMASAFGARLLVIHVAPPGIGVASASQPKSEAQLLQAARPYIEDLLEKTKATAEITIEGGHVPQVVRDFAVRMAADVLVIGRGPTEGIVGRLRSHAYAIIRESPCPVVSV